jgi:hypothetical protein
VLSTFSSQCCRSQPLRCATVQAAKAASEKDNQVDADKDGVADVKQLQPGELLTRKALILVKSINSEQVSDVCQKLAVTLFAVLATLRLKLAYALTLGMALSNVASKWGGGVLIDSVAKSLPDEARRLAPLLVNGSLQTVGFFLALIFSKSVCALYAAMQGAQLLTEVAADYLQRNGNLPKGSPLLVHRAALAAAVGTLGFAFQVWYGFVPPFLLRLVLCPASLAEMLTNFVFSILA